MKFKFFILPFLFMHFFQNAEAQLKRTDIFTEDQITFYGLDFSKAQLIGSDGFTDPFDIHRRFFENWNDLMFNEKDKYNIGTAYYKRDVSYDFRVVSRRNEAVDYEKLVIDDNYDLPKEELEGIIADYTDGKAEEGLGLVFIIQSFDKPGLKGTVWVTFFDISTKKILMARRMKGKPGGFGLRNYWAGSIYNILKDSKKMYKKWAKE